MKTFNIVDTNLNQKLKTKLSNYLGYKKIFRESKMVRFKDRFGVDTMRSLYHYDLDEVIELIDNSKCADKVEYLEELTRLKSNA